MKGIQILSWNQVAKRCQAGAMLEDQMSHILGS